MKSLLRLPAISNASSTTVPLLEKDPKYRAALSARASRTAMRIAAAEASGKDAQAVARADADRRIEESCNKVMRKREGAAEKRRQHKAREEEAKQRRAEKQAAKLAEAVAKEQKKANEKKEEAQRKAEKKAVKAREKTRKRYLGGMAWGYDPKAGVSGCLPADIQSSRYGGSARDSGREETSGTAGSAEDGPQYYDRVTSKYYRMSEYDSAWGIEIGGPERSTPPCYHQDIFAQAMAEVDIPSRIDRGSLSRDPGTSQEALPDVKGKGKVAVA